VNLTQWLLSTAEENGRATEATINALVAGLPGRDPFEHAIIDRAGLQAELAGAQKRARIKVEPNGGPGGEQLRFVALREDGAWVRLDYLRLDKKRHAKALELEEERALAANTKAAMMRHDYALRETYPDPSLTVEDLWALAGVKFEIVQRERTGTNG
jgi:hypothetical protein